VLAKVGVENVSSDFAMFFRTIVVLLALFALLLTTGQMSFPKRLPPQLTYFNTFRTCDWRVLCYFGALKIGNASQVDKLNIVFVAVIVALFLEEKLTNTNWVGIGLISAGALLAAIK
jgi:bacterial/archaeal transporter family protein